MNLRQIVTGAMIAGTAIFGGCNTDRVKTPEESTVTVDAEPNLMTKAMLSYLSGPIELNPDFTKQLTGTDAELKLYDISNGTVYFSLPKEKYFDDTIEKLSNNPEGVRFGKTDNNEFLGKKLTLDDYVFRNPEEFFFAIDDKDFRVDKSRNVGVRYRSADYVITPEELKDFITNKTVYGGKVSATTGINGNTASTISNHGAFVAKPGEQSLTRLVNKLVPKGSSNEVTAQLLLNFVTKEIDYSFSEANASWETLKRPNEVLLSGNSDCSGKTILYSSLLEQAGINHRLVYTDNHVTVYVEGYFSDDNKMQFNLGEHRFYLADTTAKGFEIGTSRLKDPITFEEIKYIQKPGESIRRKNGEELY